MSENTSPRQVLQALLQGTVASRPLFVPIVYGMAARVENLSPQAFFTNPTKISNSLRQIRASLRSDAVSCYFDSMLEVEALGATLDWPSNGESPVARWPEGSDRRQLPVNLIAPEDVVTKGRVPVAMEVIRRLKVVLPEDSLLMAGVSGPLTLAARLIGWRSPQPLLEGALSGVALEVAATVVAQISKAFAEAGVTLVFLREEVFPILSPDAAAGWLSRLAPIVNTIRFYEALPVLQIADDRAVAANSDLLLQAATACVVCASPEAARILSSQKRSRSEGAMLGISFPTSAFQSDQSHGSEFNGTIREVIQDVQPAIVTTADDVPSATDLKRLAAWSDIVRSCG